MSVFVVADAHGHHQLVAGLLQQEGLLNEKGERQTDDLVVQIGDLCNCVASSIADDLVCLEFAPEWFDLYLVGNHELPYFGGGGFSGFWRDAAVEAKLRALEPMIQPSLALGNVLVTHAGLTPEMAASEGIDHPGWSTAEEANEELRWAWAVETMRKSPVFAQVGASRGGFTPTGGILWSDWAEPKELGFSQVVGHTPGAEFRYYRNETLATFAVCIDLGGKFGGRIGGAWLRETADGVTVEAMEYRQ